MKTGLRPLNTARPVNTAHPKTTVYSARPMSRFFKSAQSTVKRPYQMRTTLTNKNFSQKVNTAKGKFYTARPKAVNTARPNTAVVNAVMGKITGLMRLMRSSKSSDCLGSPQATTLYFYVQGHPQKQDQGYVDSGCSRHMTSNMSYLSDFKEFDGGYVTFGGGAKGGRITGKFDGKSDDGFFIGYSLNSKAFRVYNIRTRKVEENLHVRSYSNNFVGTKESIGAGHSSKDPRSSQDYILMPLWKDGLLFDSSPKNTSNDEPQPSSDAGKKDDKSEINDQKKPEDNSPDVNTAGPNRTLRRKDEEGIGNHNKSKIGAQRLHSRRWNSSYNEVFAQGFEDPEFPDKVYKVEKALYGLHQAPRACDLLCKFRGYPQQEVIFLGRRLISWKCKNQTIVANSTTEAEYVAASSCCG
ncbi:putative ribonuclease H-like domain-containing protein [Tanacetum coccineum]